VSSEDDILGKKDYCDWCYRHPLTVEDRSRSRQIGLTQHLALACSHCIESGRIREPPGGWEEGADWPFSHA
jgi:hypothetical protein